MLQNSTFPPRFPHSLGRHFAVALFEPEIPLNVGSIARTCACTGAPLHLVGRLGFRPDDRIAKRAGLDYWEHAEVSLHRTWEEFLESVGERRRWLLSTKGERAYWDIEFEKGDVLVFGSEGKGLPPELLQSHQGAVLTIPMVPERRSLNLSNSVAVVLYEALRQQIRR